MENLAGQECNDKIREELLLAGVDIKIDNSLNGEVKTNITGVLGNWRFTRAWSYWVVSHIGLERCNGLEYSYAMKLYNKESKADSSKMGLVIRSGGHASGTSPAVYGCYPIFNEVFEKECNNLNLNMNELCYRDISRLYQAGKFKARRFVNTYHIDTLYGLKVFVDFIKNI